MALWKLGLELGFGDLVFEDQLTRLEFWDGEQASRTEFVV